MSVDRVVVGASGNIGTSLVEQFSGAAAVVHLAWCRSCRTCRGCGFQALHTVDAVLRLPLMDTTRARTGLPTPPLAGRVPGGRARELATGIGSAP